MTNAIQERNPPTQNHPITSRNSNVFVFHLSNRVISELFTLQNAEQIHCHFPFEFQHPPTLKLSSFREAEVETEEPPGIRYKTLYLEF